uniref:Uncharacterized protein n=2 Tax=Hucho hucho TaxID=62062 RepID=A0A4W5KQE1_9TELE
MLMSSSRALQRSCWFQFQLSYSDKDRYEREERPDAQKQILVDIAKKLPIFTRATSGAIRFCDRCQVLKPDRSHHCSVCETDMCCLLQVCLEDGSSLSMVGG